jgi:Zn-dependent protease with chaperone function
MRARTITWLTALVVLAPLVLAPAAQAYNDGRGFYGATNDKVVTNAAFIVIAFFPILIFVLTMLQMTLDRRKERRKAAHKALLGNGRVPGGW